MRGVLAFDLPAGSVKTSALPRSVSSPFFSQILIPNKHLAQLFCFLKICAGKGDTSLQRISDLLINLVLCNFFGWESCHSKYGDLGGNCGAARIPNKCLFQVLATQLSTHLPVVASWEAAGDGSGPCAPVTYIGDSG